jgi:hypothetical protein
MRINRETNWSFNSCAVYRTGLPRAAIAMVGEPAG